MAFIELIKSVLLGIIQGITEWLPVSSTGHMILFNSFWPLNGSTAFTDFFMTVIQLASILAVIILYFRKLNPFSSKKTSQEKHDTFSLWGKVLTATIPAGIIGILFRHQIHDYLYNAVVVAAMLIAYGVLFLLIERRNRTPRISSLGQLDYKIALIIGIFQMLALVPGTSRSGATIVGALLLGCSRTIGAEFSFFLAIPTMLGASLVETASYFKDYGFGLSANEIGVLLVGMAVAFAVSLFAIKFLMKFIQKHNFKSFGGYRIAIGACVLILFVMGILNV